MKIDYILEIDMPDFNNSILSLYSDYPFMVPEIGELLHIDQLPERHYRVVEKRQTINFNLAVPAGVQQTAQQIQHLRVEWVQKLP